MISEFKANAFNVKCPFILIDKKAWSTIEIHIYEVQ